MNDSDSYNDPEFHVDTYTSKETRTLILMKAKFVSSGNATFIVGTPQLSYQGTIFAMGLDYDLIKNEETSKEIWIPMHEVLSLIPSPPPIL